MRVGGHPTVVAQWQNTGGSNQRGLWFDSQRLLAYSFLLFTFINCSANFQQLSPRLLLRKFFGQLGLLVNHSTSSQGLLVLVKFYV